MFAAALLNYADDYGYFNANPGLIKGEIYPLREPSVTIPEMLLSLQRDGYIRLGSDGARRYGQVVEFSTHQKVSHPTDSKISCLSIVWDNSGEFPENIEKPQDTFVPEQGTGNGAGKGNILPAKAGRMPDDDPEFEEFWKAYKPPPNSKKPDTRKAWVAAAKARPPIADHLRAVANYQSWLVEEGRKQRREYPKQHPSTWLRGEVWNGFMPTGPDVTADELAAIRDRRDKLLRQGKYDPQFGEVAA